MNENKNEEVKVTTGENAGPKEYINDKIFWEDLVILRGETAHLVINQQVLVIELSKQYEAKINSDKNLLAAIGGLLKSFQDIAKDLNANSIAHAATTTEQELPDGKGGVFKHLIPSSYKQGLIEDSDNELEYIRISGVYIALQDKIQHLATTAYLDIFTQLKVDVSAFEKMVRDGQENIAKEVPGNGK